MYSLFYLQGKILCLHKRRRSLDSLKVCESAWFITSQLCWRLYVLWNILSIQDVPDQGSAYKFNIQDIPSLIPITATYIRNETHTTLVIIKVANHLNTEYNRNVVCIKYTSDNL
jgi:hypothetical protein